MAYSHSLSSSAMFIDCTPSEQSWVFEARSPTSVSQIPKNKEHFQGDRPDVVVKALVREGNQNSQDAKDPTKDGPARIVYRRKCFQRDYFWNRLMNGIEPHLLSAHAFSRNNGLLLFDQIDRNADVPVLIIEDYNTTGLLGSIAPLTWENPENDHTNFGNFWWRFGGSSKRNEQGGRHGVGKSTLTELSELRAIIGVTRRDEAPNLVAYGQASFFPHHLPDDNRLFDTYGIFGERRGDACYPITNEAAAELCREIGFDRENKNGLSIMIPLPKQEATDEAIIYNQIMQCYHQICSGLLVVELVDEESGSRTIVDPTTILGLCRKSPDLECMIPAISLCLTASAGGLPVFRPAAADKGSTSIRADLFSDNDLASMQTLWADAVPFAVEFEVPVFPRSNHTGEIGIGHIVIQRHENKPTAREAFSRGRVTVTDTAARANYLAIFSTPRADILSKFLGDAENPAHTDWAWSRVSKSYGKAAETMARVKNCLRDLHSVLSGIDQDKTIKNAFTDLLSVPRLPDPESQRARQDDHRVEDMPDIPAKQRQAFTVEKIADGGFYIERTDRSGDWSCEAIVSFVRAGSKKAIWNRADFDFGDPSGEIDLVSKGQISMPAAQDNRIVIDSARPGSRLVVRGFGTNRDVNVTLKNYEAK
ncbi:hypothetical protein G6L37_00480 [Agrobacterium rubi]|nr:hypothetical protein [Agrobacterium rubi]NTF23865.1 hypothetical protein [Agrobacterium rubi]